MDDLISRQAAIDRINKQREHLQPDIYPQDKVGDAAYRICAEFIERLPSVQPEQLTDAEQRIFLKAIEREEKVCKKVDEEWGSGDEECEINLVHVCHEIIRKVKGALWT